MTLGSRALCVALCCVLLVSLSGCVVNSGTTYSVVAESSDTVPGAPASSRSTWVAVIGNNGREIPQLLVTINDRGTFTRGVVSAVIQVDLTLNRQFASGAYYLPPHHVKPLTLYATSRYGVWNLGDVPHGYLAMLVVHMKPVAHSGNRRIAVTWYAARTSDAHMRNDTRLTGENDVF
jgi:hypothetical protein